MCLSSLAVLIYWDISNHNTLLDGDYTHNYSSRVLEYDFSHTFCELLLSPDRNRPRIVRPPPLFEVYNRGS